MSDNPSTLEFNKDGTFTAFDNMHMAVSGRYTLHRNGDIRFDVVYSDDDRESINAKITVRGDELTLTPDSDDAVEHYVREQ